ncbi:MAG: hypothetical protein OWP43_02540 [Sphaerochaetaceae bacterium]|nr:hypothetical protein [Sphaerochaetaceae bacterium]
MKKVVFICLFLFFITFSSCDLFYSPSDEYFWSIVDEFDNNDEEPIYITYKENQQFFMTRGDDANGTPGYETVAQAQSVLTHTTFELSEKTNELVFTAVGAKEVRDLSSQGEDPHYHVFQIFQISNIIKNKEYTITGTTKENNGNDLVDSAEIVVVFE